MLMGEFRELTRNIPDNCKVMFYDENIYLEADEVLRKIARKDINYKGDYELYYGHEVKNYEGTVPKGWFELVLIM